MLVCKITWNLVNFTLVSKFSCSIVELNSPYSLAEDEDTEEEFRKLEQEIESAGHHHPIPKAEAKSAVGETEALESSKQLTEALSNLKLEDNPVRTPASPSTSVNRTKNLKFQAA